MRGVVAPLFGQHPTLHYQSHLITSAYNHTLYASCVFFTALTMAVYGFHVASAPCDFGHTTSHTPPQLALRTPPAGNRYFTTHDTHIMIMRIVILTLLPDVCIARHLSITS